MDVLGGLVLGDVEDVVDGHDPEQDALRVGHRKGDAVVIAEDVDRGFLVVGRLQCDVTLVHQIADRLLGIGEKDLADSQIIDQVPLTVDDVDDVEGLGVLAVESDVLERFPDRVAGTQGDEVGRHQTADTLLGVAEKHRGDAPLFRRQHLDQTLGNRARQLLEQSSTIVRGKIVEQIGEPFLPSRERLDQLLLLLVGKVLEGVRGELTGEQTEGDDVLLLGELFDQTRNLVRLPVHESTAKPPQITLVDQLLDFGLEIAFVDCHGCACSVSAGQLIVEINCVCRRDFSVPSLNNPANVPQRGAKRKNMRAASYSLERNYKKTKLVMQVAQERVQIAEEPHFSRVLAFFTAISTPFSTASV